MSNTEALRAALTSLLDHYTALVNSGDAGNWNPETEPPVIAARAALAQQPAALVECHDTDSPWLVCKHCHAAGKCDKQPAASGEPVAWAVEACIDGVWSMQWPPRMGRDAAESDLLQYQPGTVLRIRPLVFGAPHPAPARVPPGWVLVPVPPVECTCSAKDMPFGRCCKVPPERETDKWESCRVADFNSGWNACRAAMLAAAPGAPDAQKGE